MIVREKSRLIQSSTVLGTVERDEVGESNSCVLEVKGTYSKGGSSGLLLDAQWVLSQETKLENEGLRGGVCWGAVRMAIGD